jgi:hypothetical protein
MLEIVGAPKAAKAGVIPNNNKNEEMRAVSVQEWPPVEILPRPTFTLWVKK